MTIGEGLLAGRTWAMRQAETNEPQGKAYALAFNEWLRQWKLHDMDKSDRAKLLQVMEERLAIEEYRAGLTERERRNANNPVVVLRKWKALERRPRSSRPESVIVRENQRLRAHLLEMQQELDSAHARIRELEDEKVGMT
jgi:hypothetical protein